MKGDGQSTHLIFWGLVFPAAVVLRLYRASSLPFVLDELSTLHRTGYGSFMELVREGIWNDVHPAGIQIFMHYYTAFFGYQEWVVKLPFIFMGLGAVIFTYYLGRRWFHPTSGLLAATLLATVQFTIFYSQIIRPYASGMFFVLGAAWFFTRYVLDHNRTWGVKAGWILFTTLALYNHYFSLMLGGIIWASAALFLQRNEWKEYLILTAILFALYVPHLPVFIKHLAYGSPGGWLPAPEGDFLWQFARFVFHFSWLFALCTGVALIYGWFRSIRESRAQGPLKLLSLAWFIIPFLIGYFYSIWRSPMLQYSGLLFGFPFLLLFVFSFVREKTRSIQFALVLLVGVPAVYSLIYGRDYYSRFYSDGYDKPVVSWKQSQLKLKDSFPIIYRGSTSMTAYFDRKFGPDSYAPYQLMEQSDSASLMSMFNFLEEHSADHLQVAAAWTPGRDWLGYLRKTYPYVLEKGNYYLLEHYLLSRDFRDTLNYPLVHDTLFHTSLFETNGLGKWQQFPCTSEQVDSLNQSYLQIDSACEYTVKFRIPFDEMLTHPQQVMDVYMRSPSQERKQHLVLTILQGDSAIHYETRHFNQVLGPNKDWVVLSFEPGKKLFEKSKGGEVVIYCWNQSRQAMKLFEFEVIVREENPFNFWLKNPY